MRIRPAHHALLCYAEWCCDNGRPWPRMGEIADDLARDESDIHAAFTDLERWGLVSVRYSGWGHGRILRLGDGRETSDAPPETPVIHRGRGLARYGKTLVLRKRVAA